MTDTQYDALFATLNEHIASFSNFHVAVNDEINYLKMNIQRLEEHNKLQMEEIEILKTTNTMLKESIEKGFEHCKAIKGLLMVVLSIPVILGLMGTNVFLLYQGILTVPIFIFINVTIIALVNPKAFDSIFKLAQTFRKNT